MKLAAYLMGRTLTLLRPMLRVLMLEDNELGYLTAKIALKLTNFQIRLIQRAYGVEIPSR